MVTWVSLKHLVDSLDWAHFNRHERVIHLWFSLSKCLLPFVCKERHHGELLAFRHISLSWTIWKSRRLRKRHLPSTVLSRTGNRFYGLKTTGLNDLWLLVLFTVLPPTRIKHCTSALLHRTHEFTKHTADSTVWLWIKNVCLNGYWINLAHKSLNQCRFWLVVYITMFIYW